MDNQRGSEFIDGVALEEYADEQDDYAQEREIEACIKAVDVDCDGKIGELVIHHGRTQLAVNAENLPLTSQMFEPRRSSPLVPVSPTQLLVSRNGWI